MNHGNKVRGSSKPLTNALATALIFSAQSSILLLQARCPAGVSTCDQPSIGPPGTPSNTIISQGPLVVSAGKTKYSPTFGIRLKHTAAYGSRGRIFRT